MSKILVHLQSVSKMRCAITLLNEKVLDTSSKVLVRFINRLLIYSYSFNFSLLKMNFALLEVVYRLKYFIYVPFINSLSITNSFIIHYGFYLFLYLQLWLKKGIFFVLFISHLQSTAIAIHSIFLFWIWVSFFWRQYID